FGRVVVLQTATNSGLARARNLGFDAAETPYVLPLDADNRLLPACCDSMLRVLSTSGAAFAYSSIQMFGDAKLVICNEDYSPARFVGANYVDAMALTAKWTWVRVGGYVHLEFGWEDYDFWCSCVEQGLWGV